MLKIKFFVSALQAEQVKFHRKKKFLFAAQNISGEDIIKSWTKLAGVLALPEITYFLLDWAAKPSRIKYLHCIYCTRKVASLLNVYVVDPCLATKVTQSEGQNGSNIDKPSHSHAYSGIRPVKTLLSL